MRQKGRPNASLQELVYHGKNPNARKKSPKSVLFPIVAIVKQPDKLFGLYAWDKNHNLGSVPEMI